MAEIVYSQFQPRQPLTMPNQQTLCHITAKQAFPRGVSYQTMYKGKGGGPELLVNGPGEALKAAAWLAKMAQLVQTP